MHFGEIVGEDCVEGILLPGDGLAFESGVDLGEGMGVGLAPSALTQLTSSAIGVKRSLSPAMSFTMLIGRGLLMWRKPRSP